jgi:hypothetical protein
MAKPDIRAPVFAPAPGGDYKKFLDELTRMLQLYIAQLSTPGHEKVSDLMIINLPIVPTGLPPGALYAPLADNIVRIVR